MRLKDYFRRSEFGLVMNWRFHRRNRWVCALSGYLADALIAAFDPVIISSQADYDHHKKHLRYLVSTEPGWSAPRIRYSPRHECVKAVFYSDPHSRSKQRYRYLIDNGFDYVFSYYWHPFLKHFPQFPREKVVHMPWAIPDQFVSTQPIAMKGDAVGIFGAGNHPAYDVRNWCREQDGVSSYAFSGVENKKMTDEEYFAWLTRHDALIAAGSTDPQFDLVTPKYFEIAAAGALLFGQDCKDLPLLGFNESNAVIFTKENFVDKLHAYRANPDSYREMREAGRALIRERHMLSHRIASIRQTLLAS